MYSDPLPDQWLISDFRLSTQRQELLPYTDYYGSFVYANFEILSAKGRRSGLRINNCSGVVGGVLLQDMIHL